MNADDQDSLGQWDSTSHFSDIARSHYVLFQEGKGKVDAIRLPMAFSEEEADLKIMQGHPHELAMDRHASIVMVFAAFAAEAAINSYGVRRLTASYFNDHLDKLDTKSKWVVIPRMVTGKPFPKDRNIYNLLKQTMDWRNTIVHPKSQMMNDFQKEAEARLKVRSDMIEFVPQAIKMLDELAVTAKELDPDDLVFGRFGLFRAESSPFR
jgi:hypothetical protein